MDLSVSQLDIEALLSIDLIIPEKLLNLVAADIQASGFDAPTSTTGRWRLSSGPALSTGRTNRRIHRDRRRKGGSFVLPKGEPVHSFIFPRLPLVYNGEYQSFFSAKDQSGPLVYQRRARSTRSSRPTSS